MLNLDLKAPLHFSVPFDCNVDKDMCDSEESDEELPVGLTPIKCGKLESKARFHVTVTTQFNKSMPWFILL